MLYGAADGTTKAKLKEFLCSNTEDDTSIHEYFAKFINYVVESEEFYRGRCFILDVATKVYVRQGLSLKSDFNELMLDNYGASFEEADFTRPAEVAQVANKFVSDQTRGRIPGIIDSESVTHDSRVIVLSTIYFKETWEHKFSKKETSEKKFHVTPEETIEVIMMKQEVKADYVEDDLVQVLKLCFGESKTAMYIVLPKDRCALADVIHTLDGNLLRSYLRVKSERLVDVELPRFKVEFDSDMKTILTDVGLGEIFTPEANFHSATDDGPLWVNQFVHKAFIDTDEDGTEAAGATAFGKCGCNGGPPPPPKPARFHANHPFLYFITTEHGFVLFVGACRGQDSLKQ